MSLPTDYQDYQGKTGSNPLRARVERESFLHNPSNHSNKQTFLELRQAFLDWLVCLSPAQLWRCKRYTKKDAFRTSWVDYISPIKLATLSKDGILSDWETYAQGNEFNQAWNTRQVQPTELVIEFDCPQDKAFRFLAQAYYALIAKGYSFSVWYAEGQRCPHIRIYDFLPDDLTEKQANIARIFFCRNLLDFDAHPFLDYHLLETGHSVQLEYSKHWHYGTMFKKVLEVLQ